MRQYANTAVGTTLTAGIGTTDTTLTVGTTTGWPTPPSGDTAIIILNYDNDSTMEILEYTGKTATTFTGVTRGIDSTTAKTHSSGAKVRHGISAANINGYDTMQEEGTTITKRNIANFVGPGVTVSDVSGKTQVSIPGPSLSYDTVQDEGTAIIQRNTLNFVGDGVTVTDTASKTQVSVTTTASTLYESNTQTVSYTIVLADATKVIEVNSASAVTVTIPTNATAAFPTGSWLEVFQQGTGQVTIAGATGVTLRSRGGLLATAGQYAELRLRKRDINTWVVSGDLA